MELPEINKETLMSFDDTKMYINLSTHFINPHIENEKNKVIQLIIKMNLTTSKNERQIDTLCVLVKPQFSNELLNSFRNLICDLISYYLNGIEIENDRIKLAEEIIIKENYVSFKDLLKKVDCIKK